MTANKLQNQENILHWANSSVFVFRVMDGQPKKQQVIDKVEAQDKEVSRLVHETIYLLPAHATTQASKASENEVSASRIRGTIVQCRTISFLFLFLFLFFHSFFSNAEVEIGQ